MATPPDFCKILIRDDQEVQQACHKALKNHPEEAERFYTGDISAFNFLLGQVMRAFKGCENPVRVRRNLMLIIEEYNNDKN